MNTICCLMIVCCLALIGHFVRRVRQLNREHMERSEMEHYGFPAHRDGEFSDWLANVICIGFLCCVVGFLTYQILTPNPQ